MSNKKRDWVLSLVASGMTTKQIMQTTGYKKSVVRYYRENSKHGPRRARKITIRRRCMKRKALHYSGGCCVKCGYKRCAAALVFHHTDPTKKDFQIGSGRTLGWDSIKLEVDKTVLLCGNCHSELHFGLWVLTDDIIRRQADCRAGYVDQSLKWYASGPFRIALHKVGMAVVPDGVDPVDYTMLSDDPDFGWDGVNGRCTLGR